MAGIDPETGKGKPGRPPGKRNLLNQEARRRAQETGLLPHEILLSFARGEVQQDRQVDPETGQVTGLKFWVPDREMRVTCAKDCANYFAAKLSSVAVTTGATDDELDELIAGLAAEAGIALGAGGEGAADQSTPAEGGQPAAPVYRVRYRPDGPQSGT